MTVRELKECRELLGGPVSVAGEIAGKVSGKAGNIWSQRVRMQEIEM